MNTETILLATLLNERADLQKRLAQLSVRLENNARVQENEQTAEDPRALLAELEAGYARLEALIARINLVNSTTVLSGRTLTEWLAHRDCLKGRVNALRGFLDAASQLTDRFSRSEIPVRSSVPVPELQQELDQLSAELRRTDETIQRANWTTELPAE